MVVIVVLVIVVLVVVVIVVVVIVVVVIVDYRSSHFPLVRGFGSHRNRINPVSEMSLYLISSFWRRNWSKNKRASQL